MESLSVVGESSPSRLLIYAIQNWNLLIITSLVDATANAGQCCIASTTLLAFFYDSNHRVWLRVVKHQWHRECVLLGTLPLLQTSMNTFWCTVWCDWVRQRFEFINDEFNMLFFPSFPKRWHSDAAMCETSLWFPWMKHHSWLWCEQGESN